MDKENNILLNWSLGLGITSIFFGSIPVIPILTLVVSYIAFIKFDPNKDIKGWKSIVGFCLGALYFLVFLYAQKYSDESFKREAIGFLFLIAIFIFFAMAKLGRSGINIRDYMNSSSTSSGGFKSTPLSQVNLEDYMRDSSANLENYSSDLSLNKQPEVISYSEITDTIIKLSEMVDKGILTQEEFSSKKKDLLNRL